MSSIVFLVTHFAIGLLLMWSIGAEHHSPHRGLFAMPDADDKTIDDEQKRQATLRIKRPRHENS